MPGLGALVVKEVKSLLRERLVLLGLIIMPALIMGIVGSIQGAQIQEMAEQAARPLSVAVAPAGPPGPGDLQLAESLARALNATLLETPPEDPASLLDRYDAVVLLEPGAAANLSVGLPVAVRVYVRAPAPSPAAQSLLQRVEEEVSAALRGLVAARVSEVLPQASPAFLAQPARYEGVLVVWGREVPAERLASMLATIYGLPVVLIILLVSAAQAGAISIGMEREAKTLEMLLSAPVSSREVVQAKILGVLAVTMMGAASFAFGLYKYYDSIRRAMEAAGGSAGAGVAIQLTPGLAAVALAALALSLYIAAVLGLILGLGAEDVRGAQLVANYFVFLLLIPYFLAFTGAAPMPDTPRGRLLLADPLYPPLVAVMGAVFGKTSFIAVAFAAQLAHLAAWTLAATRLLEPERLVAGVPILEYLKRRRAALRPLQPSPWQARLGYRRHHH